MLRLPRVFRFRVPVGLLGALLLAAACRPPHPAGAPLTASATPGTTSPHQSRQGGTACFDVSALPAHEQALADRVLLEAADGEALYTLAGGLKPLSSGRAATVRLAPPPTRAALDSLDALRRAVGALRCGEVGVFVHVFTATNPARDSTPQRAYEAVVYHRAAVARTVARHAAFFATLGMTPSADVREVLAAVENAPRAERWRGYGLLFGYPDEAVEFFVRAGVEGDSTGRLVPRDFRRIETWQKFAAERDGPLVLSSFVYAVPRDAAETAADRALREAAAPIYARYVRERARQIAADSTGALRLWREWLAGGEPTGGG